MLSEKNGQVNMYAIFILEAIYLVQKVCRFWERLKVDYSDDLLVFLAQGYRLDLFLKCG